MKFKIEFFLPIDQLKIPFFPVQMSYCVFLFDLRSIHLNWWTLHVCKNGAECVYMEIGHIYPIHIPFMRQCNTGASFTFSLCKWIDFRVN